MSPVSAGPVDVSILVPVVERHDDLRELHRAVAPEAEKVGHGSDGRPGVEFLFLVSAEFDEAFRQALELHEGDPERVRVLRFAQPVSEATALATGFDRARGETLFTLPAYFDADPAGLSALAAKIESGADMVVAARTARRDGPVKRAHTATFSRLASWASGTRFRDVASGTRALRREITGELPLYGDFHRFLPLLAERAGFDVREVDVPQDPRAHAPRIYRARTYLWRSLDLLSLFFLSHFTRRPLRLFGAVGTLFGLLGVLILAVVSVQRFLGEPLADRPILILGTLLLGLGVQAFTIGLLGELMLFFQARDVRDYRIAATYEADAPPLPERSPE